MNKTLVKISRFDPLRRVFRGLRLHKLYNWWLWRFPRTKVLAGSGVVYRARRTESVSLVLEILEGGDCYDPTLLPDNYSTFADLGCNVGYFVCWLAHYAHGRQIKGIMVDANPAVVSEARWHVQANHWSEAVVFQGIVGAGDAKEASFYVYEADTCSMSQLGEMQAKDRKRFKEITVPTFAFGKEWSRKMGNQRCHVLKIDIEGSELEFLKAEVEFLRLVDSIYVEWHKYRVSFEELDTFLKAQGFQMKKIIEDVGLNGTAFYIRA